MAYKKKQSQKSREDEKLGMEVKGLKDKSKKKKKTGGWIAHVKAYAKKHGVAYGVAMSKAKASYKKK